MANIADHSIFFIHTMTALHGSSRKVSALLPWCFSRLECISVASYEIDELLVDFVWAGLKEFNSRSNFLRRAASLSIAAGDFIIEVGEGCAVTDHLQIDGLHRLARASCCTSFWGDLSYFRTFESNIKYYPVSAAPKIIHIMRFEIHIIYASANPILGCSADRVRGSSPT